MAGHHLAQLNVARALAPPESAVMADFMAALDPINALADAAPGFVWRLQTEEGNATSVHAFADDLILLNMSVWESPDALAEYVYRSAHRDVMIRRRQWFEKFPEAYQVLWWVPAGHIPSTEEAIERLQLLQKAGPGPEAFTFRLQFPPPIDGDVTDA